MEGGSSLALFLEGFVGSGNPIISSKSSFSNQGCFTEKNGQTKNENWMKNS